MITNRAAENLNFMHVNKSDGRSEMKQFDAQIFISRTRYRAPKRGKERALSITKWLDYSNNAAIEISIVSENTLTIRYVSQQ